MNQKKMKNICFNWELDFAETMLLNKGFDLVIANPPYIRPQKINPQIKKQLQKDFRKVFIAKSDIYACFMQKAIELIHPEGIMSFVVSKTWLSLESFEGLRKYILNNTNVKSISIPPKKSFKNATVETAIIHLERKNQTQKYMLFIINFLI